MHCDNIADLWHSPPSSLYSNQDRYDKAQSELASIQFNSLFRPSSTYHSWMLDDCHPTSCHYTNSAADEEEKHKLSLVEERRKRRMISNRESARRARLRKQKQLHELWSQAIHFRSVNSQLLDELNYKIKVCGQILQENMLLRQRKLELLKALAEYTG